MEKSNFENLDIYRLAEELADAVWDIVQKWDSTAKRTVGEQVIRSADGVGACIAEGSGRGTPADNRRFLRMSRGSLYETRHWLRRAYKRNLLSKEESDKLLPVISELTPKLNAYIGAVDRTVRNSKSKRDSKDDE